MLPETLTTKIRYELFKNRQHVAISKIRLTLQISFFIFYVKLANDKVKCRTRLFPSLNKSNLTFLI